MNYHLGDRVIVLDTLSYYWSCIGTVTKVEAAQITLQMDIDGKKILRSTCLELVSTSCRSCSGYRFETIPRKPVARLTHGLPAY